MYVQKRHQHSESNGKVQSLLIDRIRSQQRILEPGFRILIVENYIASLELYAHKMNVLEFKS
jgi:hypothetical protein